MSNQHIGNGFEIGSPDDTRFSDISFPSHVSGLESFIDLEETMENADNDQVFEPDKR